MSSAAYQLTKRAVDLSAALLVLALTAPLQGLIALLIRRDLGSPVLFVQQRPGRDGAPFDLVKFRTMRAADPRRGLVSDADRLTPLGRWLRTTSLDELPTLWNVVRAEMSLVGPRPLLFRYRPHFTERERTRERVRPGITGWAQVHGRNLVTWDERLELDAWYVENRSLALDLRCLARTVRQVLVRRDVVADPTSVMADLDAERAAVLS